MNKVLVIGPSYSTDIVKIKESFDENKYFSSNISSFAIGGSGTIANNLVVLGTDTFFITRLAFDLIASSMYSIFDSTNGMLFSKPGLLTSTPHKIYVYDKQQQFMVFDDVGFEAYPAIEDGCPKDFFENIDYGIINVFNTNYLNYLVHNYPHIKWVCENSIPADSFLPYIEGIVLSNEYVSKSFTIEKLKTVARKLLSNGLRFVVVENNGKGVYVYTKEKEEYISMEKAGSMTLGCYEAFLSMFIACLSNEMSFDDAINHGLNLSNGMSYENEISLRKEFFME